MTRRNGTDWWHDYIIWEGNLILIFRKSIVIALLNACILYQSPRSAALEVENSIPLGVQFSEDSKIGSFSWAVLKFGASLDDKINLLSWGIFCCRVSKNTASLHHRSFPFSRFYCFLIWTCGNSTIVLMTPQNSRSSACSPAKRGAPFVFSRTKLKAWKWVWGTTEAGIWCAGVTDYPTRAKIVLPEGLLVSWTSWELDSVRR